MAKREGDDSLLDHRRELIGHARRPPFARPQHLKPRALDLCLPAVVGRAVHPEGPARMGNRGAASEIEELQAVAEQHVILGHATPSLVGAEGA
jgi:hypothetical protein